MASQADPITANLFAGRRLALLTEYDGSDFNGWQAQARGRTVQQTLMKALQELTGEPDLHLAGSSRTDAGVHARGHVSHFRTQTRIPADRFPLAINSRLPDDLAVCAACEVDSDFHAQYHAMGKIYTYKIWRSSSRPAIMRRQVCHVPGPLDLDLMCEAMPILIGKHDFRAFMDVGSCDRNPVRTIQGLSLSVDGPLAVIKVQGDGFLYHMVRILAGTLVAIAQKKISVADLPHILEAGDRKLSGKTMPPEGLCLEQVFYDPPLFSEYFLMKTKEGEEYAQFTLE